MDARVQEMLDHHEIRKLLADYAQACDRCDEPRMAAIYAADGWDDHGHRGGSGPDFARQIMAGMAENNSVSHLLGQSWIRVDGDTAAAETYFIAAIRADDGQGGEALNQLGGRFVDTLVRHGDGWRVKHRTAVRDWSITLPMTLDWIATQGLTEGRRGAQDTVFRQLGIAHSGVPAELCG